MPSFDCFLSYNSKGKPAVPECSRRPSLLAPSSPAGERPFMLDSRSDSGRRQLADHRRQPACPAAFTRLESGLYPLSGR